MYITFAGWDANGVPVSGNVAIFNSAGNGNTTINLGGTSQPINWLYFDTTSANYTIGQAAGDPLNFDAGGQITVTGGVTAAQTIAAAVQTNGTLTATNAVSNGGTGAGNGLIGLTLGAMNIGNSGNLIFARRRQYDHAS